MESLPTIEQLNLQKYYEVIRRCDPELYLIKIALIESGVNPMIVPKIIRGIGNLAMGTGYGKIQIFIQAKVVTQVKGEESTEVNEVALVDR